MVYSRVVKSFFRSLYGEPPDLSGGLEGRGLVLVADGVGAVRREVVVFWSPLDLIVLGAGTRIFGTIDGVKTVSAGLVGFRPPASATAGQLAEYAKLRQVRWRPAMASTGYLGGHVG